MRSSTIFSLVIAFVLAGAAVFGMREYLADQKARLLASGTKTQEKTLVVAAKPMRFGDRVRPENLKAILWPSNETPTGSFASIEAVVGDDAQPRYAMAAIDPGEPVLSSKITGTGERATLSAVLDQGMKAVSIRVNDVLGVAGFVRPSDRVDVLLTRLVRGQAGNDQTFVDVLLQGVKVLAVDQTADERKDEPSVVKTVTFEVTTDEAQRLTLGATIGTLSLALRNIASSSVEETRSITVADLGGGPMATELGKDLAKNADDGRFDILERQVRKIGDDLGKMKTPEREKQVQIVESKVEPVLPIEPKWATVGVWNTTKREEHRVGLIQ
jgi:pilus assembly protein CpaB